jgi:hypothetical protein
MNPDPAKASVDLSLAGLSFFGDLSLVANIIRFAATPISRQDEQIGNGCEASSLLYTALWLIG